MTTPLTLPDRAGMHTINEEAEKTIQEDRMTELEQLTKDLDDLYAQRRRMYAQHAQEVGNACYNLANETRLAIKRLDQIIKRTERRRRWA